MYKIFGPKKIVDIIEKVTQPIWEEHGSTNYRIISNWQKIVGQRLATICSPLGVSYYQEGVLHNLDEKSQIKSPEEKSQYKAILNLGVSNPGFSLEIQANANMILERIATYFGYRAIEKIKLQITPQKNNKHKAIVAESIAKNQRNIDTGTISKVEDEEAREILLSIANML